MMLQSQKAFLEHIELMENPIVVADVSEGSSKTKFYVIEYVGSHALTGRPEIPRELFNGMRDNGTLDCDPENRLRIDRFQAWPVAEGKTDGS